MTPSVLAIIPARGGSKGIPRKNIVPLQGKPLLAYTLEALHNVPFPVDHIVSTDDVEIQQVAQRYGGNVPYLRAASLATDAANIVDVVVDILAHSVRTYEYLLLLQPTTPLRSSEDITTSLNLAFTEQAENVCSFTRVETYHPHYLYYLHGQQVNPVLPTAPGMPRQKFPEVVWRNGAIYLIRQSVFQKLRRWVTPACIPYLMPPERSINIDTPTDLAMAEFFLQTYAPAYHGTK